MYSPHKHSYLHSRSSKVNPRIINRAVNLARQQPTVDSGDFEPPFNRLTSEQPCIPINNIDPTRRPLGFGRRAMPKLRRELHSEDPFIVLQAVTSICDVVHDPERGYEAISLRVPDRLADLLISEDSSLRERVCMALTVLAGIANGKEAIVKNKKLLTNLAIVVDDVESAVRIKAASCIEMLSRFWIASDELVDYGYIPILLDCVGKDAEVIAVIHLDALHYLMYGDDGIEAALEAEGYSTFCALLESENEALRAGGLKCLMRLLSSRAGKQIAYECNLLPDLNRLLHDERPEVYTNAASVIMFATIKSSAKIKATRVPHLPDRLVALANDRSNPSAQIYSVRALTNLCEHPEIRKVVSENYYEEVLHISVGDDKELRSYKDTLLKMVNWQPHFK